ncbi:hypothetical protein GNI_165530 [Gregarina niphandrodes]|uniref:Uncharacterized protein n=1 Tax=Gregarina niphandrodes TaxID=110365 RepID=A0A023AYP7_GRENI|nr:hypothetical protein GNI_165530 [Gregarina niphandrodes]EZG43578.1 hypothetical protein GNI_165530 [Gregarina niphandrodes]|eukprot:XP_011133186.1 hypothetical protein GNI_165530 [Gregarina niphandrodes]
MLGSVHERELEADAIVLLRPALKDAPESPARVGIEVVLSRERESSASEPDETAADVHWAQQVWRPVASEPVSTPKRCARRKPLSVLTIQNGAVEREYFTASQLLRRVRSDGPADLDGDNATRSGSIKLRDIRQICSGGFASQRPSIELRRGCVLMNMPQGIKALIIQDKVSR